MVNEVGCAAKRKRVGDVGSIQLLRGAAPNTMWGTLTQGAPSLLLRRPKALKLMDCGLLHVACCLFRVIAQPSKCQGFVWFGRGSGVTASATRDATQLVVHLGLKDCLKDLVPQATPMIRKIVGLFRVASGNFGGLPGPESPELRLASIRAGGDEPEPHKDLTPPSPRMHHVQNKRPAQKDVLGRHRQKLHKLLLDWRRERWLSDLKVFRAAQTPAVDWSWLHPTVQTPNIIITAWSGKGTRFW